MQRAEFDPLQVFPPSRSWGYKFVQYCTEVRLLTPTEMDFFLKEIKYDPSMIWNIDETSCQLKPRKLKSRVVHLSKHIVQINKSPIMSHLTALFVIQSNGRHQRSHLIIPSRSDSTLVQAYESDFMAVH
jgi:hypothetical protein